MLMKIADQTRTQEILVFVRVPEVGPAESDQLDESQLAGTDHECQISIRHSFVRAKEGKETVMATVPNPVKSQLSPLFLVVRRHHLALTRACRCRLPKTPQSGIGFSPTDTI